ncbi:MAG TPA: PDZ domain-containing protein [Candidatus Solibacter sp.]|nr:PDZ domain-containing protein [Candidatus Solibacter sp.]
MREKFLVLILLLAAPGALPAADSVDYELRFGASNTHLLDITIRAGGLSGAAAEFAMPDWAPGSYSINDYARNVQNFEAHAADGHELAWRKSDKQTWRIELAGATAVAIRYRMYANTLANNWAQYNERHAFLGGPAVWMYLVGGKERAVRLNITMPAGREGWRVATGLEHRGENAFGAADYDTFADSPIEISNWTEKTFSFAGTTYHFVVHDVMGHKDYTQAAKDTERIVQNLAPVFAPVAGTGEQAAPFRDYWFLMHIWPEAGGGLEHLNSTQINYSADWDDHSPRGPGADTYARKLFVISHEFFHAWNVKRLRPRPLGPFDYSREDQTPSLWISEGLTSYYGELALVRAGVQTPEDYLLGIADLLTKFEAEPGRTERSIEDTSWDTWFRQRETGRQRYGFNLTNTNYSYYDGGQVIGHLLDFAIRQATGNRKSLDDWMRLLYSRYALPKPGFEPDDPIRAAAEISGQDMSEFFRRYVSGKEALPYEQYFAYAGLRVVRESQAGRAWSGMNAVKGEDGRPVISNILPGSPAELAGLDRGDILVGVNGKETATLDSLAAALAPLRPGDTARLTVAREKELRDFSVLLAPNPYAIIRIVPVEKPTELQKRIYESWIGHPWPQKK